MSEQYRCTECGHFVEIQDDATCDVCHVGKMEHLRYIKGGAGSHWEGCEEVHWDCKIAKLEADNARLTAELAALKERFITRYNRAVADGKVSVDVKPVKRDLSDAEIEELGAQEAEKRGDK